MINENENIYFDLLNFCISMLILELQFFFLKGCDLQLKTTGDHVQSNPTVKKVYVELDVATIMPLILLHRSAHS